MTIGRPLDQRQRFAVLAWLAAMLFFVLIARLWFLQVVSSPELTEVAAGNRTREIVSESPRGQIFDTSGELLAGRRESLVVTLDWTGLRPLEEHERSAVLVEVAHQMNLDGVKIKAARLEEVYERAWKRSLQPVIVAEDVSDRLWVTLQERSFPGIVAERRTLRTYPYREVAAHLIGYVGTVQDQAEADELNEIDDAKLYQPGDEIGRSGLEAEFDRVLRGTPEITLVEVNARNEIVRTIETLQPGEPGADLHLTLDIQLQAQAERVLQTELLLAQRRPPCEGCVAHTANAGSIVVVDTTDGSILTAASHPGFSPGDFLFGMTQDQADYLFQNPDQPFVNRAVSGLYAPGSTFKPFTAYAAVVAGARDVDEIWLDEGRYRLTSCGDGASRCVFQNAEGQILGEVDLPEALSRSSDTYFYAVGEELWLDLEQFGTTPVQDVAELFGFGAPSGVAIPGERSGRVPTPERRRADHRENPTAFPNEGWFAGDNVNLAIGQGDLLVTPLQLANAYAMLATGGVRHEPQIVGEITNGVSGRVMRAFEPLVTSAATLDPTASAAIRRGLEAATVEGTAREAFAGFPAAVGVAGKTGTSQVNGKADYSLFAGYGPIAEPRVAIAVVLEQAGFGSEAAAPAARTLFDHLLAGVEIPPRQPFSEPEPIVLPPLLDDHGNPINEAGERIDEEGNVLTPEQIAEIDGVDPEAAEPPATDPVEEEQ